MSNPTGRIDRRKFLGSAAAAGLMIMKPELVRGTAANSAVRLGLLGCGGRGTADATYLYYTLGKLEIMKLRADLTKKQGAAFNLEDFHNNFMRQGFAPIKIIRKAMLHDDSPVL